MDTFFRVMRYIIPFVAAYLVDLVIEKLLSNDRLRGKLHLVLLRSVLRVIVWGAAIITAVSFVPSFSRTWETVIASSGVVAVVLGLAAQSTLANVFSGIALSAVRSRPFDIGDRVQVGDYEPGFVIDINLRHVAIRTYRNELVYIPNSIASSSRIINYTQMNLFSYPIDVSVAYGTDLRKAMNVVKEVITSHPKYCGDPDLNVLCKECQDSGILLRAIVTTAVFQDNPTTCSDCLVSIVERFEQEGIEIPFPQVDVHAK